MAVVDPPPQAPSEPAGPLHAGPSAAIIDQLGQTHPSKAFVHAATQILANAGFIVDYYHPSNATVDLYRALPSKGYDLLVLRSHSSAARAQPWEAEEIVLFTNEAYSPRLHVRDQEASRLSRVGYDPGQAARDGRTYFGVRPALLRSAEGDFGGASVFVMGCEGLANLSLAQAFLEKGAGAYVGWNATVTADQTDATLLELLRQRYAENQTLENSVNAAMRVSDAAGRAAAIGYVAADANRTRMMMQ